MAVSLEQIRLPDLACPFPSRINPHGLEAYHHTSDWLKRFQLLPTDGNTKRNSIADVAWLAARIHPDTPREPLQLVSKLYAWVFYHDDRCEGSELGTNPPRMIAKHKRLLAILQGAEPTKHDEPLAHALYDLRHSCLKLTPCKWQNQLIYRVEEFFNAMVWETTNRIRKQPPSLTTYVQMRPITAGLRTERLLVELTEDIKLPMELQSHAYVQQITLLADQIVCLSNDLFSFPKEIRQGDFHNLVLVLQHEDQIALEEAVKRATTMHDSALGTFINLTAQLPSFGEKLDPLLERYLDILRTRISGSYDWMCEVSRYQLTVK